MSPLLSLVLLSSLVVSLEAYGYGHYPGAAYPGPAAYPSYYGHPASAVNHYGGTNIGQLNKLCLIPGTCNIQGSTVYGRKKRQVNAFNNAGQVNTFEHAGQVNTFGHAGQVNTFNHAGQVNTFGHAGVVNTGAAGNPYGHLYSRPSYSRPSYSRPSYSRPSYNRPVAHYPAPGHYYPRRPINSYAGANIGQLNENCMAAGTCNIHNSHVVGK